MITTSGIVIRMAVSDISILGRITSGVILMNMDEGVEVASMTKVREPEQESELDLEQDDQEDPTQNEIE